MTEILNPFLQDPKVVEHIANELSKAIIDCLGTPDSETQHITQGLEPNTNLTTQEEFVMPLPDVSDWF